MIDKELLMLQAKLLRQQGFKVREIAEQIGRCERTVYTYLKQEVFSHRRKSRESKLAPFYAFIDNILQKSPDYNRILIFESLKKQGYTGGITILRDYCAKKVEENTRQAVIRFETEPGLQAQVDWKVLGKQMVDGKLQKLYAFVMVLGFSRFPFVMFTTSMKQSVLLHCHQQSFKAFGGVPKEILYDNMKTAWVCDSDGVFHPNKALLHFANHTSFIPRRCRLYRPQTKGKVERFIDYLTGNFWPQVQKTELTLDELNTSVSKWICAISTKQIRELQESRVQRFEREKTVLQSLAEDYDCRETIDVKVNRESFITFKTNRYSVPPDFVGKMLTLRVDPLGSRASLYDSDKLLRSFELQETGSRQKVYLEQDKQAIYAAWEKQNRPQHKKDPDVDTRSPGLYDQLFAPEVA